MRETNPRGTMHTADKDALDTLTESAMRNLRRRTTEQLVADWIEADKDGVTADNVDVMPTVRGWVMDALEERDPQAFAAWLDTPEMDNDSLRALFLAPTNPA